MGDAMFISLLPTRMQRTKNATEKDTETMKRTNKALGLRLKESRESHGVSLRVVGEATGIKPSKLSRIERGLPGLSFIDAARLCELYQLRLPALAGLISMTEKGKVT